MDADHYTDKLLSEIASFPDLCFSRSPVARQVNRGDVHPDTPHGLSMCRTGLLARE